MDKNHQAQDQLDDADLCSDLITEAQELQQLLHSKEANRLDHRDESEKGVCGQ